MITPIQNKHLIGHDNILMFFEKLIKCGKLHNSYIFEGEYGIGKETVALYITKMITCNGNDAVLDVIAKRMQNNVLENFYYLKKDDAILIEDAKSVIEFLSKKTTARKCIVIDSAENMTVQAANAMLKAIEDAKDTTFFLITSFPERIINTIKSRSVVQHFKGLNTESIQKILSELNVEIDNNILEIVQFSVGLILKIDELEKEYGFFSLLVNNIVSKQIKIDTSFKENIDVVMQIIYHIFEKLFCGNYFSFAKSFIDDAEKITACYQNVCEMYKKFQLYNFDKDAFLNYVFNEINIISC